MKLSFRLRRDSAAEVAVKKALPLCRHSQGEDCFFVLKVRTVVRNRHYFRAAVPEIRCAKADGRCEWRYAFPD